MTYFDVKHKFSIITLGVPDIGLNIAKELLKNGGVALIGPKLPSKSLQDIEETYGPSNVVSIEANLADINQFEAAIKKSLEIFKHLDILVNTADWSDSDQMKHTLNSLILGFEKYLPTKKSGTQAVLINILSTAQGEVNNNSKSLLYGLTHSWGTKDSYGSSDEVKVLGLYVEKHAVRQRVEQCAISAVEVLEKSKSRVLWILEGQVPVEFVLPERHPNAEQKWWFNSK
ncbi:uncharacterized protein LOC126741298 isoform X2 [Anthonomus grandis grandis]|uniref:uncharacterized protein LOC126741298 isoform X2 n=1 Tax=Anthonomus grandis grandis TaxID=2921223 RepID=UPI0021665141|nr:uncharacterized protein LOC126741298 isoform X2 [Anthonomus grandis grandis]